MEGYAVSGQCMALVRDNCLVPTKDAPELGYIRESSDKCYVPDVYYKVSKLNLISIWFSLVQFHLPLVAISFACSTKKKRALCLNTSLFL